MENKRSTKSNGLVKAVANTAALMGTAAAANYASKADAGMIRIVHGSSDDPGLGSAVFLDNDNGESTLYDTNGAEKLQIYSKEGDQLFAVNSHPQNTTGWDFQLGVANSPQGLTANGYLDLAILDSTGLEGKSLAIYDITKPEDKQTFAVDIFSGTNTFYRESLDNQQNSGNTPYANWRVDIVPEPATGLMATIGIGAAMAGAYLAKKFSRR